MKRMLLVVSDGKYDHYNNRYSGDYDFTTFIVNGDSDILLVNGEAGIGKSAFMKELYLAVLVHSIRNNCLILPLFLMLKNLAATLYLLRSG